MSSVAHPQLQEVIPTSKCLACGVSRDDDEDYCPTCGHMYGLQDGIGEGACNHCHEQVVFVKSAKTGKAFPVNPRWVQLIDKGGRAVRGRVPHQVTCPRWPR